MINLDTIILEFVKNNLLAIGLFLALLKGIAKITPSTTDDKIVTLLNNLFAQVRPNGRTDENKKNKGENL